MIIFRVHETDGYFFSAETNSFLSQDRVSSASHDLVPLRGRVVSIRFTSVLKTRWTCI